MTLRGVAIVKKMSKNTLPKKMIVVYKYGTFILVLLFWHLFWYFQKKNEPEFYHSVYKKTKEVKRFFQI